MTPVVWLAVGWTGALSREGQEVRNTHLLLLLVEVVYDDTDEQIQGEERPKDDEDDKVQIHVQVFFIYRLQFDLDNSDNINIISKENPWTK